MRKVLLSTLLLGLSTTAAYAADDGFYIGAQAGWADPGFSNGQAIIPFNGINTNISQTANPNAAITGLPFTSYSSSVSSNDIGAGAFIGYQFMPYIATELGYIYLPKTTSKANGQTFVGNSSLTSPIETDSLNASINEQGADLVLKFMLPFGDSGFDFYAKGGAAYIHASQTGNLTVSIPNVTPPVSGSVSLSHTTGPILPLAGGGFSYDITGNWVIFTDYMHIFGNNSLPDINFASLGVSYHFC